MDENVRKLRVGIFVLMAMVILGILILVNSGGWVSTYDVYVKVPRAPGVTVGTPIRKNGILIGRVKDVDIVKKQVLLKMGINRDDKIKIYENETCSIGTESFLGDAVVEFTPPDDSDFGPEVQPEHTMENYDIQKDPLKMLTSFGDLKPELSETLTVMREAGASVKRAGDEIEGLSNQIKSTFDDEGGEFKSLLTSLNATSTNAELAFKSFEDLFTSMNSIVGDPTFNNQIKQTVPELIKFIQELQVTAADTRLAIQKFGTIPDNVNTNLNNLEVFTGKLKSNGPEIIDQIDASMKNIDQLVGQIQSFTKSLENFKDSKGTIAKLLNDDEVYDAIMETVTNARDISVRLEPLMNDLRAFTDAIARDPGSLGVRGALDRRPGKTGYKGSAGRDGGLFQTQ